MNTNDLKALLSLLSLLAMVVAIVCYLSHQPSVALPLAIGAVVCKLAELFIRFSQKRKK